ncbi:MAG: hypothetical protein V4547_18075 [Bacteroidota bacterium]
MEIKLSYVKMLEDNGITASELPARANLGIKGIQDIIKLITLNEKNGRKITNHTLEKIKANDEWVCRDIEDYVKGKKTNTDPIPNKIETIITEIKTESTPATTPPAKVDEPKVEEPKADERGTKADAELKELLAQGKTSLTLAEIKTSAKNAYDIIFDAYKEGEENGFDTTYYSVRETEKEVFTISKI